MTLSRRVLLAVLLTLLAFLGSGCVRWTIVRQAAPNPLLGAKRLVVEPMHWESAFVGSKPEEQYFADKEEKQRASYATDKAEGSLTFAQSLNRRASHLQLIPPPPPNDGQTFIVRPIVNDWEPGYYVGVARQDAYLQLTVQILGPAGVIDEFRVISRVGSSLLNPSSGGRMRTACDDLGDVVGKYLIERTGA